jgi:hypothetical protein
MDIEPTKSTIKIIWIGIYRLKKLINITMIIAPNAHLIKEPKSIHRYPCLYRWGVPVKLKLF